MEGGRQAGRQGRGQAGGEGGITDPIGTEVPQLGSGCCLNQAIRYLGRPGML